MSGERRQYRNPPILEALCEIRFETEFEWDVTTAAELYSALRSDYPAKPLAGVEAGIQISAGTPSQIVIPEQGVAKTQLRTNDDTRMVTVSSQALSVHVRAPYPGWEDFRGRILHALQTYLDVAPPASASRIGVRYVNNIAIPVGPDGRVLLPDYLNAPPDVPDSLDVEIGNFLMRIESSFGDNWDTRLIQTMARQPEGSHDALPILLDLDVIRAYEDGLPLDRIESHVEEVRDLERIVFESMVTDKSRELFDA